MLKKLIVSAALATTAVGASASNMDNWPREQTFSTITEFHGFVSKGNGLKIIFTPSSSAENTLSNIVVINPEDTQKCAIVEVTNISNDIPEVVERADVQLSKSQTYIATIKKGEAGIYKASVLPCEADEPKFGGVGMIFKVK